MKILGRSSLSSTIKVALDLLFAVVLLCLITVAVITAIAFAVDAPLFAARVELPVSAEVLERASAAAGVKLSEASVKIEADGLAAGTRYVLVLTLFAEGLLFLAILRQLREIFGSLAAGTPFSPANVRRVQAIAALVFATQPLDLVHEAVGTWGARKLGVGDASFLSLMDVLSVRTIFFAFVLLVIAEVVRIGVQMKDEQELTV